MGQWGRLSVEYRSNNSIRCCICGNRRNQGKGADCWIHQGGISGENSINYQEGSGGHKVLSALGWFEFGKGIGKLKKIVYPRAGGVETIQIVDAEEPSPAKRGFA